MNDKTLIIYATPSNGEGVPVVFKKIDLGELYLAEYHIPQIFKEDVQFTLAIELKEKDNEQ